MDLSSKTGTILSNLGGLMIINKDVQNVTIVIISAMNLLFDAKDILNQKIV
ncbi:5425_t:CDS:2 [Acaulospora morrowiae]|uniref:5425_t:CDS:1 n=1 Tax=Acaulospora morrowiae TaxID=94023 RepID=A0A9N9ACV6_9GLOM|nr:5425_t:CDS:2 [Acaulospora morrowiae]